PPLAVESSDTRCLTEAKERTHVTQLAVSGRVRHRRHRWPHRQGQGSVLRWRGVGHPPSRIRNAVPQILPLSLLSGAYGSVGAIGRKRDAVSMTIPTCAVAMRS